MLYDKLDPIELVRGAERSRRYDHRRNTSGSSSSRHTPNMAGGYNSGISMRSTSGNVIAILKTLIICCLP